MRRERESAAGTEAERERNRFALHNTVVPASPKRATSDRTIIKKCCADVITPPKDIPGVSSSIDRASYEKKESPIKSGTRKGKSEKDTDTVLAEASITSFSKRNGSEIDLVGSSAIKDAAVVSSNSRDKATNRCGQDCARRASLVQESLAIYRTQKEISSNHNEMKYHVLKSINPEVSNSSALNRLKKLCWTTDMDTCLSKHVQDSAFNFDEVSSKMRGEIPSMSHHFSSDGCRLRWSCLDTRNPPDFDKVGEKLRWTKQLDQSLAKYVQFANFNFYEVSSRMKADFPSLSTSFDPESCRMRWCLLDSSNAHPGMHFVESKQRKLFKIFKNDDGTQVSLEELVRRCQNEGSTLLEPPTQLPQTSEWTDDDSTGDVPCIVRRDQIWETMR